MKYELSILQLFYLFIKTIFTYKQTNKLIYKKLLHIWKVKFFDLRRKYNMYKFALKLDFWSGG
jgi:hypothetical protein